MAKKKTKKKTGRRGGGRKPGAWTLLTPEAFKSFRKGAKLSRNRLADLLGVSSTSVQNWETGKSVPLTRFQDQIVTLMQGGTPEPVSPKRKANGARSSGAVHAGSSDAALKATGEILSGYLATASGGKLDQEQVVALAASLRAALS